jgi:hypothetical protein
MFLIAIVVYPHAVAMFSECSDENTAMCDNYFAPCQDGQREAVCVKGQLPICSAAVMYAIKE